MKYLLDTNVCIRFISGRSSRLREIVDSKDGSTIFVSSITKAEMYFGSENSQIPEESRAIQDDFFQRIVSLPFDDYAADHYGRIRFHLKRRGTPISPTRHADRRRLQLRQQGMIVVTHNTRHFSRIPGLRIEDWEAV